VEKAVCGFLLFFLFLCACTEKPLNTFSFRGLGGDLSVAYAGPRDEAVEKKVVAMVTEMSATLNYYDAGSLVTKINREAHTGPVPVPPWFCRLLERAVRITRETEGKFDITYKSEGFLWDIHRNEVPDPAEVRRYLPLVGVENLTVDCSASTVAFKKEGVRLDFGGIAAGYAADETRRLLEQAGIRHFLVNYTGEIVACGTKHGRPWRIGVRDPFLKDHFLKTLEVPAEGCLNISTSGDYERYLEKDGKRYSHIVDPGTGLPVQGAHSVTVSASDCTTADALATALSVGWRDHDYIGRMKEKFSLRIYMVTGSAREISAF